MLKLTYKVAGIATLMLSATSALAHHVEGYVYCDANNNGIIDAADQPVSNVFVSATGAQGGNGKYTDASGYYYVSLPGRYYGIYEQTLNASDLPADTVFVDPITGVAEFEITVDDVEAEVDWLISSATCSDPTPLPASLGDRVWIDTNIDGVQDNAEPGLDGVTVDLYSCGDDSLPGTADDTFVASTTTGTDGEYLFTDLTSGSYFVSFAQPAGFEFTGQDLGGDDALDSDADAFGNTTVCTILAEGEENLTIDAGVYEPAPELGSLGDRVWLDNDEDGLQGATESGVDGVNVDLYSCGADAEAGTADDILLDSTLTDGTGSYLFTDLEAGDYFVSFGLPADHEFTSQDMGDETEDSDADNSGNTICTTLYEGEDNLTLDAGLVLPTPPAPASLGDQVWVDENQDGIQDANEIGLDGVNVDLYACGADAQAGTADDVLLESTLTDGLGNYLFTDLEIGNYYVVFAQPTGYQFTGQDQGGDDATDSDANGSGQTICTSLEEGEEELTIDAGLFLPPATCNLSLIMTATPGELVVNSGADCETLGKPTSLTFEYTGGGCAASNNEATNSGDSKAPTCEGSIDDQLEIVVSAHGKKSSYSIDKNLVAPGERFTISASKFDAESFFTLENSGGQEIQEIHTSCSAPLKVGDVFGSMTLVGFNNIEGESAESVINYSVTNNGDEISDLLLNGSPFGHSVDIGTLASGSTVDFDFIEEISQSVSLSATVAGTLADGAICSAADNAEIVVKTTPTTDGKCKGKKGKKGKCKDKGKGKKGKKDKGKSKGKDKDKGKSKGKDKEKCKGKSKGKSKSKGKKSKKK